MHACAREPFSVARCVVFIRFLKRSVASEQVKSHHSGGKSSAKETYPPSNSPSASIIPGALGRERDGGSSAYWV